MKNFYHVLGVNQNSDIKEIKQAYRKLSKKFHPDMNDQDKFFEERFKEIQEAYSTLSDTAKRNAYDLKLRNFMNQNKDNDSQYRQKQYEQWVKEEELRRKEEELMRLQNEMELKLKTRRTRAPKNTTGEVKKRQPRTYNRKSHVTIKFGAFSIKFDL